MNTLKKIAKSMLVLTFGVTMNACSSTEKWKEEVQLSDGRIMVVEREMLRERGGDEWASNRSGTKPKEYRIQIGYPEGSGQKIEWRSTKKSPQTWPEIPLILDMEAGLPVVISIVADRCHVYSKYVYRDAAWIKETLPEKFEQRTTNLLLSFGVDMPKFVDLETKRKLNKEPGYPSFYRRVGPNLRVCGDY